MNKLARIKEWYLKDDWWHFIIGLTLIYMLGLILELTGLWWTMIIAAAIGGAIIKHGGKAIIAGFVGVFFVWGSYFLSFLSLGYSNPFLFINFLNLIGSVIGINGGVLIFISLLIGGLVGVIGSVNAAYLAQIIIKITLKEEIETKKSLSIKTK
ncbi:MAG: hypothetical protein EAX96_03715 [Candidatus Lokiarchaeota archaeon]|nr:hypothetical protein [Candidatus Lokiarchaeota archaeon]